MFASLDQKQRNEKRDSKSKNTASSSRWLTRIANLAAGLAVLGAPAAWSAPLVGWYKFDDPSDLGKDYSGSSFDATISGSLPPIYTSSGYSGGAADFQG